jgi:penicillin-binding protein 1A
MTTTANSRKNTSGSREIRTRPQGRLRRLVIPLLILGAVTLGVSSGLFVSRILDVPSIYELEDYTPSLTTTVLSADGVTLARFALEKRINIDAADIPQVVKDAVLAAEDSHFYQHTGIDPLGIARAVVSDIRHQRLAEGGSTLTQQLAKLLFLNPEKSFERKIKEAVLAIRIELNYTKDEIMGLYCNQVCFDHAVYGIEMASRYYFSKPAAELARHEAALLVGIPRRPSAYSPIKNPERALLRRNWVLDRMLEENMIDEAECEAEKAHPLELKVLDSTSRRAPHFTEEIRKYLKRQYGDSYLERGLQVHTTIDSRMQEAANDAVRDGLLNLSRLRGFRGIEKNSFEMGLEGPELYDSPGWRFGIEQGRVYEGVVLGLEEEKARVRVGPYQGEAGPQAVKWTRRSAAKIFKPGDITLFRVLALDPEAGTVELELEQEPLPEAALLAIDNASGQVRAMVGGYSFERNAFNCAVQARRQPGSAFKPILLAAAVDNGFTLADTIFDEPTEFPDPWTGAIYRPQNYYKSYNGLVTLRKAIEDSINVASVKLNQKLGPDVLADYAQRMGFNGPIPPYLSVALGSAEVSLMEITSVYAVFPNLGVAVEPYYITQIDDAGGNVEQEFHPSSREVLNPVSAYLVTSALEGVIERGTGEAAKNRIPGAKGGKTGTTDEYTNAWFIGFTPELTVGVWVGFADKSSQSLGNRMAGAVAALPIWTQFLEAVIDPESVAESRFEVPPGVIFIPIERNTGLRAIAGSGCTDIILEAFREGTEPSRTCTPQEVSILALPWQDQKRILGYF